MTTYNTKSRSVKFAKFCAEMAFDQVAEYSSQQDAIDCYRVNLSHTLQDEGGSEFEDEALNAFDDTVAALRA